MRERTESVLPTKAGEERAVGERGLAVKVELRSPPARSPVVELCPEGVEVMAGALRSQRGDVRELEVASLLEIVIVGEEVGTLLGDGTRANSGRPQEEERAEGAHLQRTGAPIPPHRCGDAHEH